MPKAWSVSDLEDAAAQQGRPVTARHIRRLCEDGTIEDATKIGGVWIVGDDAARRWLQEWTGQSNRR